MFTVPFSHAIIGTEAAIIRFRRPYLKFTPTVLTRECGFPSFVQWMVFTSHRLPPVSHAIYRAEPTFVGFILFYLKLISALFTFKSDQPACPPLVVTPAICLPIIPTLRRAELTRVGTVREHLIVVLADLALQDYTLVVWMVLAGDFGEMVRHALFRAELA
jgi:hypothetical protein